MKSAPEAVEPAMQNARGAGVLDLESSNRIAILRFPLIVGVVFIHAYASQVDFSSGAVGVPDASATVRLIQNVISQGVARTAVPLFFLMSGYLFFLGFRQSVESYLNRYWARVKTLLIPFLVWNAFTLALNGVAQSLPGTREYFSGRHAPIATFDWFDYVDAIFGINRLPISYQFWFIRDLMILVLATPIIRWTINKVPSLFIVTVSLGWLAGIWPVTAPSSEATMFFSIGASLAIGGKSLFLLDEKTWPIVGAYVIFLSADLYMMGAHLHPYVHRLGVLFGVAAILCLSKPILRYSAIKELLLTLASASFFVFAAHEPLLTMARKIVYKLIQPSTSVSVLALYFIIPVSLIVFLVFIYRACARNVPGLTRVVVGGR